MTCSSVVSKDSVRISVTIAALNDLDVLACDTQCDIQNALLCADCRESIWVRAGHEFGSEAVQPTLVVGALYGLRSSGALFRLLLAETLDNL